MTKTVGKFTYEDGAITGPALYLQEQGNALIRAISRGEKSAALDHFLAYAPDAVTAVLVYLQTDYAGWLGTRDLIGRHNRTR